MDTRNAYNFVDDHKFAVLRFPPVHFLCVEKMCMFEVQEFHVDPNA